jgi:hypothetical protein
MCVMDLFRNSLPPPPPPGVAEANPVASQKTPWLAHSYTRLRASAAYRRDNLSSHECLINLLRLMGWTKP